MGYILIHPDNSQEPLKSLRLLAAIRECLFELRIGGPRLCPVTYGSRSNLPYEAYYIFFVGEIDCNR